MVRESVASRATRPVATLVAIALAMLLCADGLRASALSELTAGSNGHARFIVDEVRVPRIGDVRLALRRFDITNDRTRFVVVGPDGQERASPLRHDAVRFLRGTVIDVPGSHVFLALHGDEVSGRLSMGPGIGAFLVDAPAGVIRVRPEPPTLAMTPPMSAGAPPCATPDAPNVPPAAGRGPGAGVRSTAQVRIAIEGDDELRQLFETSDETLVYLITLHAIVADMYLRDLNTTLLINFIRVWEIPDPYGVGNPIGMLRSKWSAGEQPDVPRDLVHLCSGRRDLPASGQASGIATIADCTGWCWSGYLQGIAMPGPSPFARDAHLAAHEIGHLLGGRHTHEIGVDDCPSTDPPHRGTTMSYCALTFAGEYSVVDLRMHRVVADRIRDVVTTACLGRDCNRNGLEDSEEITIGRVDDDDLDGVPDECQDCDADHVLDREQIIANPLLDFNGNLMLDSCEPDCDRDGTPDAPDNLNDSNGNGILDQCEADRDENGISDLLDIHADMTLDLDRNAVLDEYEDCDENGVPDLVQLDAANGLWVADDATAHLTRYVGTVGVPDRRSAGVDLGQPRDVITTPDGRVLVTDASSASVLEYDIDGSFLGHLVGPDEPAIDDPATMAITPAGTLAVVSRARDAVAQFDLVSGAMLPDLLPPAPGGPIRPFGIAFDDRGRFVVTSIDNRVLRYGPDGTGRTELVSAADGSTLDEPRGLLFVPNGSLIVASHGNDVLLRYDGETGAFRGRFDQVGTLPIDDPWCMRLGPDGGLYVSRSNFDNVEGGLAASLRRPRILHLDAEEGRIMRVLVQGRDSGVQNPLGFAFIPSFGNDCNQNLRPDECDLADGSSLDVNENLIPDECEPAACLLDLDDDGEIDIQDLLVYLDRWLDDDGSADVTGDGSITILDLLHYLDAWLNRSPIGLCS